MTRAELEQVRAAVWLARLDCCGDPAKTHSACSCCGKYDAAKVILDAELAKPEAREWGVKKTERLHITHLTKENAVALLEHTPGGILVSRTKESRTPAGPWVPAE